VTLKKTPILLAAGVLAGATLLAPASARAVPADRPGALALSPSSGPSADNPVARYRAARACPADHRAGARVFLYDGSGKAVGALSESITPKPTPPSGALDVNSLSGVLAGRPTGDYQLVLGCFDAAFRSIALTDVAWIHVDVAQGTWRVVPHVPTPAPRPTSSSTSASPGPARSAPTPSPRPVHVDTRPATVDRNVGSPAADGEFTFTVDTGQVTMSEAPV